MRVHVDLPELADEAGFPALVRELQQIRPLSRAAFDDWLVRANGLGYAVQGSLVRLEAGSSAYLASLHVTSRRWQGLVHLDNRGPTVLGREIAQLSLAYGGQGRPLRFVRLDVAAATDDERLHYAGLSGRHRLGGRGADLGWSYARSESALPVAGTGRSVEYQRERAEIDVHMPLVQRARMRAEVKVGLRSYDLDETLDEGRSLESDRIRALEAGYDLVLAGRAHARHSLALTISRGATALGASLEPAGPEPDFISLKGTYDFWRRLGAAWHLKATVEFQASPDRLPASERFFVGGRSLGGAFDPATLSGDQGLGARLTVERTLSPLERSVTAFAYLDDGYVRGRMVKRTTRAPPAWECGASSAGSGGSWKRRFRYANRGRLRCSTTTRGFIFPSLSGSDGSAPPPFTPRWATAWRRDCTASRCRARP